MIKYNLLRLLPAFLIATLLGFALAPASSVQADSRTGLVDAETTGDIFADRTDDPYTLAVRAYTWGMPLVEWAKVRMYHTRPEVPCWVRPATNAGAAINRFGRARQLYGPDSTDGVGPNNDTLYTNGWFDLAAGPFVVEMPDFGERYYTFTVYMEDTTSKESPGQRTHGGQLPPLLLHGADYDGPVPEGMLAIEGTTRYILLAGRILVGEGVKDLKEVHALQDRIRVRTLEAYKRGEMASPPVSEQRLLSEGKSAVDEELLFLNRLGNVLRHWRVAGKERALVDSFARIGLSTEHGFDPDQLSSRDKKAVLRGLADARDLIRRHSRQLGAEVNGWTTNFSGGVFGDDYLLRAAVARDQIGVSVPEEAIYPIGRVDADGQALDGSNSYRILFPAGELPPVDAFWSITLYDDTGTMVANPIDRYSIGDRTPGLVTRENGDLAIRLQSTPPEDDSVNWLPAPEGPFYLMMRLYHPRQEIFDQNWLPPPIERL